jgi:Fe-S-cluster containining protein
MRHNHNITWHEAVEGRAIDWSGPEGFVVPVQAQAGPVCINGVLRAADRRASLEDLVPAARRMADRLVGQVVAALEANGQSLSCCAKCAACCEYLIPVSPPEAIAIWQDLLHLPGPQREQLVSRFLEIMHRVDASPPPDLTGLTEAQLLQTLSDWYSSLDSPCPLLEEGLCSIYEHRPLVCRECLSVYPASFCAQPLASRGQRVPLPFSIAEVLYETTGLMLAREPESVILSALPSWIDGPSERYENTWPAIDIVRCFTGTLHRHAQNARRALNERVGQLLAQAGI